VAARGVLIVAGPTASGKTELALALARAFDAEIVGADARQIYRGMPIGTAAPTPEQRALVPHHVVAFLDPHERYSAARFVVDARAAIDAIHERGREAIVVGGTGFYVRALCGDVALDRTYDPALRDRVAHEARTHPPDVLHAWLQSFDRERAAAIAPHDPYRVARALEIALARRTGARADDAAPLPTLRSGGIPYLKCWLEIDAATLDRRIAERVDRMLAGGLVAEAERVGPDAVAADAVGYREALAYAAGWATLPELRAQLIRATRRYARRQATWFRAEREVLRLPPEAVAAAVRDRLGWERCAGGCPRA
jgi:tRNA dimethylallyltransferase